MCCFPIITSLICVMWSYAQRCGNQFIQCTSQNYNLKLNQLLYLQTVFYLSNSSFVEKPSILSLELKMDCCYRYIFSRTSKHRQTKMVKTLPSQTCDGACYSFAVRHCSASSWHLVLEEEEEDVFCFFVGLCLRFVDYTALCNCYILSFQCLFFCVQSVEKNLVNFVIFQLIIYNIVEFYIYRI